MRIGIIGSRSITSYDRVQAQIRSVIYNVTDDGEPVVVVTGGAKGVDTIAERIADEDGYDKIVFRPYFQCDDTADYDPRHYHVRNRQIIQNSDGMIAVWDGESRGTASVIKRAQRMGVPIQVITLRKLP